MWPRWNKSSAGPTITTTTAAAAAAADRSDPSPKTTSSFKDIRSLLLEDPIALASPSPKKPSTSSVFHRVRVASSAVRSWKSSSSERPKRIVVYHTSLRVVRKTFEDCRAVRSLLRGLRVAVDERDLSMDLSFLAELKGILGKKNLSLPRVFIGGRYIGGAEEVLQLHESGELRKYIEGVPAASVGVCDGCGGVRFVLCGSCNGSRKYYHCERDAFRTCSVCNENGLVRCADCCDK